MHADSGNSDMSSSFGSDTAGGGPEPHPTRHFLADAVLLRHYPRIRKVLVRIGAMLLSMVLLLLVLTASAAWYTSRPQFCNSCHIMEPYYTSWLKSPHKDVTCIECHFAPGLGGKIRGKMLGLVQLTKYITRSAGTRPSAEIPNASCLRSGCHETRLLQGRVNFHGITFDHTPHLTETRRGKSLRCTSCHSQIVQGVHMAVTESTCFLCHFKGEKFNEGLSSCTRCHQIPEKSFDLGGGVKFTHELAYKKGVDCFNCHADVIRGQGEVPHERCLVCHNREGDLAKIKDTAFMHAKHVTEHAVNCLNCHLQIEHSLDTNKLAHAASDCAACHPNHHHEQVEMAQGIGGLTVPGVTGGMSITRIGCPTCHRFKEVSTTGTTLWKASAAVCVTCHEAAEAQRLQEYNRKLTAAWPDLETTAQATQKALEGAALPADKLAPLKAEMAAVRHDLDFLHTANGIHNIHYAAKLNEAILARLKQMATDLKMPQPKVQLPESVKNWK